MLHSLCLVSLLFSLAACVPQSARHEGVLRSDHAGLEGAYTRQIVISNHPRHTLVGHLIEGTQAGVHRRMLVIGARRDGVHRVTMHDAWSNGIELPFVSTSRRFDGCTHDHCLDRSVGFIVFSDRLFAHAATHGLSALLVGSGPSIEITVPASLFSELPEYRAALRD